VSPDLADKMARVRLVGFDIDGVFTDGRFYLSDDGVETKAFNTQDGYGIRCLVEAGIAVAVISGRPSRAVEQRMRELGVEHVHLGSRDKLAVFDALLVRLGLTREQSAYVGDDVPDLPLLRAAGLAVGVANAHPDIRDACDWLTTRAGGAGAVREVCDRILSATDGSGGRR